MRILKWNVRSSIYENSWVVTYDEWIMSIICNLDEWILSIIFWLDNNIEDRLLCIMLFFFNKKLITIIKCLDWLQGWFELILEFLFESWIFLMYFKIPYDFMILRSVFTIRVCFVFSMPCQNRDFNNLGWRCASLFILAQGRV
jgi:hypothetical protein